MGAGDLPPRGQLQGKENNLPQLPLALAAPATPKPTTKPISSTNGDENQPHTPSLTGPVACTTRLQTTRLTQPSNTRGLDEPISPGGVLQPSSTVDGHNFGPCMESVNSPAKQVPQKSLRNITIFANPDAAAKVKVTTPMMDCRTVGDKYITNGNPIATSTLIDFARGKYQSMPTTEAMCSPIAPATPNQSKRVQGCMPSTVGWLVDERELVVRSTHRNGMSKPSANEPLVEWERTSSSQHPDIQSREAESSQRSSGQEMETLRIVEGEEQGTDSSKTSRQKPKRRKHRPKVVREDKSNTTPKPATPKPVTPEPIRPKQQNRVKRTYVRKKLELEHPGIPSTTLHERMDQCDLTRTKGTPHDQQGMDAAKHGRRKYVRKRCHNSLESKSEMVIETDGGHKAENPHQNIETEIRDRKRTRRKYMSQKKSAHDSETPPDVVRGTANMLEQVGYKTRLVRKRLNFDSEGQTVNGKSMALLTNSRTESVAQEEYSDTIIQSASKSTVQLNNGFKVELENKPAGEPYNLNHTLSKMLDEYIKLPEKAIPTQLCHGERIEENSRELVEHRDLSSCTTNNGGVLQIELQDTKIQDGANGTSDVLLEENIINKVAKRVTLHEVQRHETSRQTAILPIIYKKRRTEMAYRKCNINSSWTYFGFHMYTIANLDKLITLEKSQDKEDILRFDQMEVATRKRSKVPIRARNSCSLAKLTENLSAGTSPKKKSRSVSETLQDKAMDHIRISYIYDNRSTRNIQKAVHSNLMTQDIVPYVDPVDDIVQKLKYLSIAGGSQTQNALTLYARETMMLPLGGPFELTLKRQPRPKVDLDPETDRVWKLLMGKAGNNEAGTMNIDKEKWWQEERQVFRGRVDSFVARMHLVQGDRRFCPWKGSVVDSVVGVFLTQNVSDHLSSSAFMALAARFPRQPRNSVWELDAQKLSNTLCQQDGCKQQCSCSTSCGRMSILEVSCQLPMRIHEADNTEEEMANKQTSLRCNIGEPSEDCSTINSLQLYEKYVEVHRQIPDDRVSSPDVIAESNSLAGIENKALEDLIASQAYGDSSERYSDNLIQMDQIEPSSNSNSETELAIQSNPNCLESFSFMELLQIKDRALIHSYCTHNSDYLPSTESCCQLEMPQESSKSMPSLDQVNDHKGRCPSKYSPDIYSNYQCKDMPYLSSIACHFQKPSQSGSSGVEAADKLEDKIKNYLPPADSGSNTPKHIETTKLPSESVKEATTEQWQPAVSDISVAVDSYPCRRKPHIDLVTCSVAEECFEEQCSSHLPREESKAIGCKETQDKLLQLHEKHPAKYQQNELGADLRVKESHHAVNASSETHQHSEKHQTFSTPCNNLNENSAVDKEVELNRKDNDQYSQNAPLGETKIVSVTKKVKVDRRARKAYDWDSLRKHASGSSTVKQRNYDRRDSLDWEAIRNADVAEISQTIRERGMNNVLAERIKDFLNRLVLDHGSIDLEWLRDIEPDKAKDYLLSIRGLGLKSVECVRLLTLQHLAFPVDTNVGRICVRLGWVPLQPLPESLQLHLLELYPVLETIQKYLWPRLCTLDQRTLYELHYQMITFGKVFCTKSKPNCNACPMRGECKHFASAFASARLALPTPEDKSLVSTTTSTSSENKHYPPLESWLLPHPLVSQLSWERPPSNNSEPIIEEPMTPEPENKETLETEIEDSFYEDPDQIPIIQLNLKEFAQNLQDAIRANNIELQDGDLSKALVTISPEAASIPMPKLKNVGRLRTEHQVYELPDSHPLLEEMDQREPDDPSPYLLAIWTPGETAESTEPPEICCNSQDSGALCDKEICFACNSICESRAQTVRGTLLIPCRTAMRGSFPLNGTYFQVNEVFADHDSSFSPLDVPRGWIWNLPRRTVYFGTSVPTIFRGLTTEEIQKCFWRGFVCVRGFDRKSRAPKPLYARLHFPASKARRNRKQPANEE